MRYHSYPASLYHASGQLAYENSPFARILGYKTRKQQTLAISLYLLGVQPLTSAAHIILGALTPTIYHADTIWMHSLFIV